MFTSMVGTKIKTKEAKQSIQVVFTSMVETKIKTKESKVYRLCSLVWSR